MAYLEDSNNSTSETIKRFDEARARYRESINKSSANQSASQPLSGTTPTTNTNNLIDFITTKANKDKSTVTLPKAPIPVNIVKAQDNIVSFPEIPIPLPVQNTGAESPNIPIPLPVKATGSLFNTEALKKIAHEDTLQQLLSVLREISKGIMETVDKIIGQIIFSGKGISDSITEAFLLQEEGEKRGWVAKFLTSTIDKIKNLNPLFHKSISKTENIFKFLTNKTNESTQYLRGILTALSSSQVSSSEEARSYLNMQKEGGPSAFQGLYGSLITPGGTIDSVFQTIKGIKDGFINFGKMVEKQAESSGIMSFLGTGAIGSILAPVLGLFGGIAGFVAAVAGSAIFSSLYAMFKHPEQLTEMLGAFGRLFSEVVLPMVIWVNKEVMPIIIGAFTLLGIALDKLLDTFGTSINKSIVLLIDGIIYQSKIFGSLIDAAWQGIKEVVLRIAGIFGIGKYGDEGFFENIIGAWWSLSDGIMEMFSVLATELIKLMGLQDFFGLKEGEGLWGRIKRFFGEDIPNFAISLFDKLMAYIEEVDPIGYIQEKIKDFTEAISNLVPTWDGIKKWLLDSLPSWTPDFIKRQLEEDPATNKKYEPVPKPSKNVIDKVDLGNRPAAQIIYAPSSVQNNSSSIQNNSTSIGGLGISSPSAPMTPWTNLTYQLR